MGYEAFIEDVGALVMGATTYAWVLAHQERSGESWSYTQPCWVLTHRDLPLAADTVRLVSADSPEELRRIHAAASEAAGDKDVWLVGGGGIAAALADLGLLDALMVSVAPVTLGSGKRLLEGRTDLRLTRRGAQPAPSRASGTTWSARPRAETPGRTRAHLGRGPRAGPPSGRLGVPPW